jgi:hypothetical protein
VIAADKLSQLPIKRFDCLRFAQLPLRPTAIDYYATSARRRSRSLSKTIVLQRLSVRSPLHDGPSRRTAEQQHIRVVSCRSRPNGFQPKRKQLFVRVQPARCPVMGWSGRASQQQMLERVTKDKEHVMSQLGQSRRFGGRAVTSGLPRQADILSARWHVSKVPTGDMHAPGLRARQSAPSIG